MVIILRGISGSGKSSVAKNFIRGEEIMGYDPASEFLNGVRSPTQFELFSADDYFMVDNEYMFDPRYLPAAHESCLRRFATKLGMTQDHSAGSSDIGLIVDNTNTTLIEVMPYLALAQAYAHEIHVITLISDPVLCTKRNKHGVPFSSIISQDLHLKQSILDWPQRLSQFQQIFPH